MAETPQLRGPVTRAVARLFVKDWRHAERAEVALRLGILASTLAVLVNAVLFGVKLGFGLAVGSLALLADAVDTFGDILLDLTALVALLVSLRAPDAEHPYGHERAEEIAALAVATVLVVIGLQFGAEAGRRYIAGDFDGPYSTGALVAALSSVLGKLMISVFAAHIGAYTGSQLVKASVWHNATDTVSGLLAAAAILGRRYGWGVLDPIMGLLIAVLIVFMGAKIFRSAAKVLLGRGASTKLREEIHLVACHCPGVLGCSDIEVHYYGRKRRVSLRIQVPDSLTLREGHEIAERVQKELHGRHADWEPVVHVDPVTTEKLRPTP